MKWHNNSCKLSKKTDYPTNNQPSYFGLFGETTHLSHSDQPLLIIATSSKRFAVEKKGARVMHTAMAHLRSCRWFKLKPISRTREVAYFCQGEYIRRIIVARNQIEVARHEKWIMNSTLRTPHTYIHNMPCLPGTWCGLLVLSNSKEDDFFHVWTQGRIFQGSLPRSKVKMIVKLQTQKKRSTWLLCDAKTYLELFKSESMLLWACQMFF